MKKILIISTILLSIISCKKEGCVDTDATNYNSIATKDDGSCSYESSVTFWWSQSTYNWLYSSNFINKLIIYVDDEIVFSQDIFALYWSVAPNCEKDGLLKYKLEMGGVKALSKSYKVVGSNGSELWSGNIDFEANSCSDIQLTN